MSDPLQCLGVHAVPLADSVRGGEGEGPFIGQAVFGNCSPCDVLQYLIHQDDGE